MSVVVCNKLVAAWTNEELRDELDNLVCWIDVDPGIAVIAEAVSRLMTASGLCVQKEQSHD